MNSIHFESALDGKSPNAQLNADSTQIQCTLGSSVKRPYVFDREILPSVLTFHHKDDREILPSVFTLHHKDRQSCGGGGVLAVW